MLSQPEPIVMITLFMNCHPSLLSFLLLLETRDLVAAGMSISKAQFLFMDFAGGESFRECAGEVVSRFPPKRLEAADSDGRGWKRRLYSASNEPASIFVGILLGVMVKAG